MLYRSATTEAPSAERARQVAEFVAAALTGGGKPLSPAVRRKIEIALARGTHAASANDSRQTTNSDIAGADSLDPAHVGSIRELLHSAGVTLDTDEVYELARHFGAGIELARPAPETAREDVTTRVRALVAHARAHRELEPLDEPTRRAVESATGISLGDVRVERNASLPDGRLGEASDNVIRLSRGVSDPSAPQARHVRIHEAVHVAQTRVVEKRSPGDRGAAVELEAHVAVRAIERGERSPLAVRADRTQRYGFDLADAASSIGLDPMAYLRSHYPAIAQVLQGGPQALVQRIGDSAGAALQAGLAKLGIGDLQAGFDSVTNSFKPGGTGFGILHGCCECLDHALNDLMQGVQGALHSNAAQKVRHWIELAQDFENNSILDSLTDFFATLQRYGGPVIAAIQDIDHAIGGSPIWHAVAPLLGLDGSLTPLQAIKKKLEQLWDTAKAGVIALKNGVAALWAKIKANPVVAGITKLINDCGKLWAAIQKVREAKTRDPQKWLAILAKELKGTVFEGLVSSLQSGYTSLVALRDAATPWLMDILGQLGVLAAWNSAVPYLNAIGRAIQAFAKSIQQKIAEIKEKIHAALTRFSNALKELWEGVKPYVDFVVGLGIAIAMTAAGDIFAIPRFVVGELWLHVLPHCYKEAITNFLLDLFIALVEWFPAKHPVVILLRSAALSCLRTIKAAPSATKIRAMDTIAKVMSNDVEVLAGFFVGVVKGLWNSSLGFIVQMAIFPLQMAWDVLSTIGSQVAALAGKAFGVVFDGASWLVQGMANAKPVGADGSPIAGSPAPAASSPGAAAAAAAAAAPAAKVDSPAQVDPSPAPTTSGVDTPEGATSGPNAGASTNAPGTAPGATPAGAPGGGTAGFDDPPPFPKLPPLGQMFDQVFTKGVSRAELEQMFKRLNLAMDQWGTKLGKQAADKILPFLTSETAPYDVGELIGEVVGWLAGEIIMLVASDGIENAIAKLTEGILDGAKIMAKIGEYFPKLFEWLMDMRKMLEPVIEAIEKIAAKAKAALEKIMKWLEEMMAWVKRQWQKLLKWAEETFGEAGKALRKLLGALATEGELEIEAEEAANVAFAEIDEQLLSVAVPFEVMEEKLRTVRVPHTPDVQIHLHLETETSWHVIATARKGEERGIGRSLGRGAVLWAYEKPLPYYTAGAHGLRHEALIDEAWIKLETEAKTLAPLEPGADISARYKQVEELAQTTAKEFQELLPLRTTTHFLIKLEPLDAHVREEGVSTTEFIITPNASKKKLPVHIQAHQDNKELEEQIKRVETEYTATIDPLHNESKYTQKELENCGGNPEVATYRDALVKHEEEVEKLNLQGRKLEADIERAREWYRKHDQQLGIKVFKDELFPRAEKLKLEATGLEAKRPKGDWDTQYAELRSGTLRVKQGYTDIRTWFYPHDYRTTTKARVKAAMQTKTGPDGLEYWFYNLEKSPRGDDWWLVDHPREMPTVAHNSPTVKDHWEGNTATAGRATNQPARVDYYNLTGKPMELEPKTVNSRKGGTETGMSTEVKKTFRGRT